jgi:hypothetical protein
MLLANMAKDDKLQRVLELKRDVPKELSTSTWAIDQLLDCFVKGAEGGYNKDADFDYLSYFFADLAKVGAPHARRMAKLTSTSVSKRPRILYHTTTPRRQHHPPYQDPSLHLASITHSAAGRSLYNQELRFPSSVAPNAALEFVARPYTAATLDRRESTAVPPSSAHGSGRVR